MNFLIAVGIAILGALLFVLGLFQWHNILVTVFGFLLGVIGMVALRFQSE